MHEVVAGAVVAMNEGGLFVLRRVDLAPAQAPFERRMRFVQPVEVGAIVRDVVARVHRFQKTESGVRWCERMQAREIFGKVLCEPCRVGNE